MEVKTFCQRKIDGGEILVLGEIPGILRRDWLDTKLSLYARACTHVNVKPDVWRKALEAECKRTLKVYLQRCGERKGLIAILMWRAGLAYIFSCLSSGVRVCHLDVKRNERTLEVDAPMPINEEDRDFLRQGRYDILVPDPMLASGSSMVFTIDMLNNFGIANTKITLLCVVVAPEGVFHILNRYSGVRIIAATMDSQLDEDAYIVNPGLGDAGEKFWFRNSTSYFSEARTFFDTEQWAHLEQLFKIG